MPLGSSPVPGFFQGGRTVCLLADKEKELAAKRNAFLRYMTIIFAVAFLLVLISLVLQAHTAKAALSDLKESNSSALSNAAVNAELLQDENRKRQ